jgi:hypothetical protein
MNSIGIKTPLPRGFKLIRINDSNRNKGIVFVFYIRRSSKKTFMQQMNVPEDMKVEIDFNGSQVPASVKTFRPLLFHDGNSFCCVLGPDPQAGIFGCGPTPEDALKDWHMHLIDKIKTPSDDEVSKFIFDTLSKSEKDGGNIS